MLEEVRHENHVLAIILRNNYTADDIVFFSQRTSSLQLGYMNRDRGYSIQPHIHNKVKREILDTQEVLIIRNGKIKVDFYSNSKEYLESKELVMGDIILIAQGGHGITMLEPTEMIEVKTGPYLGIDDKERF